MQPPKSSMSFFFISAGLFQLLVGPASSFFSEQIKVFSSARATSSGWERHQKLPGCFFASRGTKVPALTIWEVIWLYSSSDPSQRWILEGLQSAVISSIHWIKEGFLIRSRIEKCRYKGFFFL